jgi:hypothetical protein
MAAHLLEAGYELVAYDIQAEAVDEAVSKGAARADSCRDVAARSELVISMVPDSPDVEQVAMGENGFIDTARAGLIYVDARRRDACRPRAGQKGRPLPGRASQRTRRCPLWCSTRSSRSSR